MFSHAVQADVSRKCVLMLSRFSDCFICARQHALCSTSKFGAHNWQLERRSLDMFTVAHSPSLSALVVTNPSSIVFFPSPSSPFCDGLGFTGDWWRVRQAPGSVT